MKVLEFGLDGNRDNEHFPANYQENLVVYIGTHDNAPIIGWYDSLAQKDKDIVSKIVAQKDCDDLVDKLINMVQESIANTVIIQMQDYLHLGQDARINTPSTVANNWVWRLDENYYSPKLVKKIASITKKAKRC